jgi:hypothetical protein
MAGLAGARQQSLIAAVGPVGPTGVQFAVCHVAPNRSSLKPEIL